MKELNEKTVTEILERRISSDGYFPSKESIVNRISHNKKLLFYYGIDPTGRELHLGHLIQLLLLKALAQLGHRVVILLGDFTARIGDPTGKDKARISLSKEEVIKNMAGYKEKIENIVGKNNFELRNNSEWFEKMNFEEVLNLMSTMTVQQMIVRDMFQNRLAQDKPIGLHEFCYPLMQGYDSVVLQADGEIGGHDQVFNMLVGRDLERKMLDKDKIVLATRLIVDPRTGKKMSKSEGEIISLSDDPGEIRRKVLAFDDSIVEEVFMLCTDKDQEWIIEKANRMDKREYKEKLAESLTEVIHGKDKIKYINKHKEIFEGDTIALMIKNLGFAPSLSESKKLVSGGAVEIDGSMCQDWNYRPKRKQKIRVGKGRFAEVI